MTSHDGYPGHEHDIIPPTDYVDHWREAAEDPTRFGFEPHTSDWAAFRGLAYHNDQKLRFFDAYLREAIPPHEKLLLEKDAADYSRQQLDISIFYDITNWYRNLGSFNNLHGALELGLRATAILERLADNPLLSPELRESMDITTATLYHELALSIPVEDKSLFQVLSGEALQRYEFALTDPDGMTKAQRWVEQGWSIKERVTPPRIRSLQQAAARYHDLLFERVRRNVLEAMDGDIMSEVHPHIIQNVQAQARRMQALALNDFMAFASIGSKKAGGEPLIKATAIYDWFVVLAIRNKHIVDNSGTKLLQTIVSRQVRTAFPREDAPHDGMRAADLPALAFDMLAQTYDRTGRPTEEVVPVQIKAQGGRYVDWQKKTYAPLIYVLDVKEEIAPDGQSKVPKIDMRRLTLSVRELQKELAIPPGDARAIQRRREGRAELPFQFDI